MKAQKFGQLLILFNALFCMVMAVADAINNGKYIFISEYFFAGGLLFIILINLEIYYRVTNADEDRS